MVVRNCHSSVQKGAETFLRLRSSSISCICAYTVGLKAYGINTISTKYQNFCVPITSTEDFNRNASGHLPYVSDHSYLSCKKN